MSLIICLVIRFVRYHRPFISLSDELVSSVFRNGPASPPHELHTLLVRSSRLIGMTPQSLEPQPQPSKPQPVCTKVSENVYEAYFPSLVTPKSLVPGGNTKKSIRYAILEVWLTSTFGDGISASLSGILFWIVVTWRLTVNYNFPSRHYNLRAFEDRTYDPSDKDVFIEEWLQRLRSDDAIPMLVVHSEANQ